MITPVSLIFSLLLGLFSLFLPILGIYLIYRATHPPERRIEITRTNYIGYPQDSPIIAETRLLRWHERLREPSVWVPLALGTVLCTLPITGRSIVGLLFPNGDGGPTAIHGEAHTLHRADGTTIHAEVFGKTGAPVLIFTHGWSTDEAEWYYAKKELAGQFRIITWDLPGLGESAPWADQQVTLERMATDLHTVLALSEGKQVVFVGHSIGGMINLTYCHLYPQDLGRRVAGIVEVDSSYTNPVRTTKGAQINLALQKPVAEPILHAMIPLSGIVHFMNWISYHEGLLYLNNAHSSFDGTETLGQVDLVSRYQFLSSQAVVARGTLAMFHWDMTPVLPLIHVPVLIIVGRDDTTTLPDASKTMADAIPGAQLQVLAVGRHYALLESHQAVDSAIGFFGTQTLH